MANAIGTLSTRGWVIDAKQKLDQILAYYQAANPSQTIVFNGHVVSLQRAVADTAGNVNALVMRVKHDLGLVLSNNFPEGANVDVDYTTDETGAINLIISSQVNDNGTVYDIASAINDVESLFVKVTNSIRAFKNIQ